MLLGTQQVVMDEGKKLGRTSYYCRSTSPGGGGSAFVRADISILDGVLRGTSRKIFKKNLK